MARLRASEVFKDSNYRLIAIESIDLATTVASPICGLCGRIEPIALIVCGTDGIEAIDMRAGSVDLAQLRRDVPGLDSMIPI